MTTVLFGNPWHGTLTDSGMTPDGGTLLTSVEGNNGSGGTTTFDYIAPVVGENLGNTYYYKQPEIAEVDNPDLIAESGGELKNDAILFGSTRRYSPFGGDPMLGLRQWLHYGSDGKWRKMALSIVSLGSETTTVRVHKHQQFGVMNKEVVAEDSVIADLTLSGIVCTSTVLSDVDARYDGRQIIVYLLGKWTALSDPSIGGTVPPFDNYNERAIAAVWRIDVPADCTSATATRIWAAALGSGEGSFDRSWYVPAGDLYFDSGNNHYYQPYSGIYQGDFDYVYSVERLIGAAFDAEGTIHLIKFLYQSTKIGVWADVSGDSDQGFTPVEFTPRGGDLPFTKPGTFSSTSHPTEVTVSIDIKSNSTVLKTISGLPDPALFAFPITNNAFDLRSSSASSCRVGPGCIEDSVISGDSPFASFNPRSGEVVSSDSPIGFV